nr:MAG TPA: hypothetical protein [Caudoviricetes sp.]
MKVKTYQENRSAHGLKSIRNTLQSKDSIG